MSEYVKCPLCGIETKANEAHGCAGPRVEVIDPRDETIQRLRAQLADAEAACAGYRAALDGLTGMFAPHGICEPVEGFAGRPQDLEGCIRQALQSNPGKAVGDVIAAAKGIQLGTHNEHQLFAALAKLEGRK